MHLKKISVFLLRLTVVLALLIQTSCFVDSTEQNEYFSGTREDSVVDSRDYDLAVMNDKSSFIHADRINSLGFEIDWSVRLQNKREIRNFYILKDSVIIETKDHQIHSLNRHNGHYNWIVQIRHNIDFKPFMQYSSDKNRMLYIVASNFLYCIDCTVSFDGRGRELGKLLWKYKLDHYAATSAHASDFDVIIGCENSNYIMSIHVKQVSLTSNKTNLIVPKFLSWHRALPDRITSAPASSEDPNNSTAITACHDGKIYGFDFATGKTKWEFPKSSYTGGAFRADLVFHAGKIFAVNNNHTLYILDKDSGAEDGKITLQSGLNTPPVVVGSLSYELDNQGNKITKLNNDIDIFVQGDPNVDNDTGDFHRIVVKKVVVAKNIDSDRLKRQAKALQAAENDCCCCEEEEEEEEELEEGEVRASKIRRIRRWDLEVSWKLTGKYEFLFRTENFIFLRQHNNLLKINRKTGELLKTYSFGSKPLKIFPDVTSDYLKSRLYVATERDVYSIQLKN